MKMFRAAILQGLAVRTGWAGGNFFWFNFLESTVRTFGFQEVLLVSGDIRVRQKGGSIGEVSQVQRRLRLRKRKRCGEFWIYVILGTTQPRLLVNKIEYVRVHWQKAFRFFNGVWPSRRGGREDMANKT